MHVIHESANLQTNLAAALSIHLKLILKINALPLYPIIITIFIQFVLSEKILTRLSMLSRPIVSGQMFILTSVSTFPECS